MRVRGFRRGLTNLFQPPSWSPSRAPGVALWLRPDVGYNASTGAWSDLLSTSGLVASASANRPTLQATGGPNGSAAMQYAASSTQWHLVTAAGWVQPFFVWIVAKWTDVTIAANQYLVDGATLNTDAFIRNATGSVETYAGTATMAGAASPNAWQAWGVLFSGASSYIHSNDTTIGSGTNTGTSAPAGITIGGPGDRASAFFSNALIADIVVCTTLPSAPTLANFANYRKARYGF